MRLFTQAPTASASRLPVTRPAPVLPQRSMTAATTAVQPQAPGFLDQAVRWVRGLFQGVKSTPVRLVSGPSDPFGGGAPTVTVQPGDTLGAIARAQLGDASRWREIFEANRDQISDPNLIYQGQVLKLPGVAEAPAAAPAPQSGGYTVQAGDTLGRIAQQTLGDGNRWREIFEANRDQISNPNIIWPGLTLKIPGGASAQAAPAAAPSVTGGFGDRAVAEGRQLQAQGYHYTVNLTSQYNPVRFQVGCCADFAVDTWAKAGVDIYHDTSNPHYCPTLVNYFKAGTSGHQWVPAGQPAKPGDMVFFSWNGDGADHVAIVTEVDGNGRPLKIIESYNFNLPVRERYVGDSQDNIMGYGRA